MAEESQDVATRPHGRKLKRVVLGAAGTLGAVLLLAFLVCRFLGIRSPEDVTAYRQMAREHYHPIWKDLALRRIKRGDDLEDLLGKHTPRRRGNAGPYAELVFTEGGAYPGLTVMAKDGKLIAAVAGAATWHHVFFDGTGPESFDQVYPKYRQQRELESVAYMIHCAITAGQDVFVPGRFAQRDVPDDSPGLAEMTNKLKEIYGDRYVQRRPPMRREHIVEVDTVLYGDLEPGTPLVLTRSPITVEGHDNIFLHVEDDRLVSPYGQGNPATFAVPRAVLAWYQALTPDQKREFELRWSDN